ncbi:MAG: hypothetical protein J3Q66DRAFT_376016 [Benniella sp.]|nr:MAG: hypothetical protein J3Q66DRAFT_376016 [Benniella sp.]
MASPHRRRMPNFNSRLESSYMSDVRSLSAVESAVPPPRKAEQLNRRRFANVAGVTKDLTELASRDHDQVIRGLNRVAASAKRRRDPNSSCLSTDGSTESNTDSNWDSDNQSESDSHSDDNDSEPGVNAIKDPDLIIKNGGRGHVVS